MTQSQHKLTLTLVLVTLLASNVIAFAQAGKTSGAKEPTPAAKQSAGGLQLDGPTNSDPTKQSLAAPAASIDDSDEIKPEGLDLSPIPDAERQAKGLGEQNIIVTASEATRLRELELKVDRLEQLIEGQSSTLQAIHEELVKLNSRTTVARPDLGGETPSLAALGKLVVNNYTAAPYTLSINGYQFVVPPGRGEFNVQYGALTTQLVGYEAPKSWAETDWREVNGQKQLAIQIQ